MKSSRAPFVVYRTTSKDPKMALSEIHKGLMINRISYKQVSLRLIAEREQSEM